MIQPELEKRYEKALVLLRRIVKAEEKLHWQEGETYEDVVLDIRHFLSDLKLEEDIRTMKDAYIIPTENQVIIFDSKV
jgi:hypothetical protein